MQIFAHACVRVGRSTSSDTFGLPVSKVVFAGIGASEAVTTPALHLSGLFLTFTWVIVYSFASFVRGYNGNEERL